MMMMMMLLLLGDRYFFTWASKALKASVWSLARVEGDGGVSCTGAVVKVGSKLLASISDVTTGMKEGLISRRTSLLKSMAAKNG